MLSFLALPTNPTKPLRKSQIFFTTAGLDSCNNSHLLFPPVCFFPFQCIVSFLENLLVQTAPLNLSVIPLLSLDISIFHWLCSINSKKSITTINFLHQLYQLSHILHQIQSNNQLSKSSISSVTSINCFSSISSISSILSNNSVVTVQFQ